ncbi:hypothetical protein H8M03_00975 [Sphingomonas sabuli]|uniref:Uncharacterized protein n=1 Tax=Sphingomonas sabuli TaxID=2764186 RepID=A0A7G9L2X0_9SPHN|nr:hypothetical protein [Sphingomonas sabuli]QNM82969.1 hypothetical protein H8M03_00975 [Sphingomonas sabuli]
MTMRLPTPDEIAERLTAAIPARLVQSVTIEGNSVEIACGDLPALGGATAITWQEADGWPCNIYAPRLIYEEWSLEQTTVEAVDHFAQVVKDLFAGIIIIETWYFRRTGTHWRTRLVDPRKPAGAQVVTTYNRTAYRWLRPVRVERTSLL